jgi:endonuclease/exonuclease/phosphatase (EEP) superfamily protein YafD
MELIRTRFVSILRGPVRAAALLLLIISVTGFLARAHWVLELTCHFRIQYLFAAAACWVCLLLLRDWRWSLTAAAAVVLNGSSVAPWHLRQPNPPPAGGTPFRVMLANVYTQNRDHLSTIALVLKETPDVLVLQEVDDAWTAALKPLDASHPHSIVIPRGDNFGIGIWSKTPLLNTQRMSFSEFGVPSIATQLQVGSQVISLLATHPIPPASRAGARDRNVQLRKVAEFMMRMSGPSILIGDLNTTMWSPHYTALVRDTGLRDCRRGFGVLPTWPTFFRFLMIPLDHCLVSRSVGVRRTRVGPPVGSDHLPLVVDLVVSP